jgi:GNAT superfamily N-acetyltransferase
MQVEAVPYDDPVVAPLLEAAQRELFRRYGERDQTPIAAAEFSAPAGLFLLGRHGNLAAACGGWRAHDRSLDGFSDGDAEIKRMFVVDSLRGKGFARALLAELERTATAAGRVRMVLETGYQQPEAVALYESSGYEKIDNFGHYRCHPDSVCFGKDLAGARKSPNGLQHGGSVGGEDA